MKQFVKTILYECLAGVLMLWAGLRCAALGASDLPTVQSGLRSAEWTLLILACVWIGGAIYMKRSHVRQHPDLRADMWFGLGVGAALMILWLIFFWTYGGLTSAIDAAGIRARNWLIVCMSGLPMPFLVRASVLAFFSREEHRTRRLILCAGAVVCLLVFVGLIVFGGLMNTLPVPRELP